MDRAGGNIECGAGLTESDIESFYCNRGPQECRAFKAAVYHEMLYKKYRLAVARPWLILSSDPPHPPDANPQLEIDPYLFEIANEKEESSKGFK